MVSKLLALQAARPRAKDLDDLQSIFDAGHDLNLPYLAGQMSRLDLKIPGAVKALVPEPILVLDKARRRAEKAG